MSSQNEKLLGSTKSDQLFSGGFSSSYSSHTTNKDFFKSIHTSYMASTVSYGTTTNIVPELCHDNTDATYSSFILTNLSTETSKTEYVEKSEVKNVTLWNLPLKKKLMLGFLTAGNVLHMMAYSLIAPFFPREARMKDVSPTIIGFIFSTYMLVSFLISPIYGANITRIGPRFMFVAGLCVGGACAILFGLLEFCPPGTPFITLCFLTRLIEAFGMSAHTTVSFAIASNEFSDQIATVYGILEGASSFGFMIGPVAGSFLYEAGGFGLPFYVMGVSTLLGGALVFTCLPKHVDTNRTEQTPKIKLLKSLHVWVVLSIVFMCAFSSGFIDSNLAIHAETKFATSPIYIGVLFTIWSVVYAFTAPVWGWLTDKRDISIQLIVLGLIISACSHLLIGPSPILPFIPSSLWVVILALSVNSLGIGWALVPTMKCLITGARDLGFGDSLETFGVVSGLFQCFLSLGSFSGPFIGGMMVESIGFTMSATIVGFIFLSQCLVASIYFCVRHKC